MIQYSLRCEGRLTSVHFSSGLSPEPRISAGAFQLMDQPRSTPVKRSCLSVCASRLCLRGSLSSLSIRRCQERRGVRAPGPLINMNTFPSAVCLWPIVRRFMAWLKTLISTLCAHRHTDEAVNYSGRWERWVTAQLFDGKSRPAPLSVLLLASAPGSGYRSTAPSCSPQGQHTLSLIDTAFYSLGGKNSHGTCGAWRYM